MQATPTPSTDIELYFCRTYLPGDVFARQLAMVGIDAYISIGLPKASDGWYAGLAGMAEHTLDRMTEAQARYQRRYLNLK